MFSNLRTNSQIYILHKDANPRVEIATVTGVSMPRPKFPIPQNFGQVQDMVIDVDARIGEQSVSYKGLPATGDVADSAADGVTVTTGRDAMNAEVSALRQRSIDAVNSIGYHKGVIAGCDRILETINPEYAEKQAQQAEIAQLKSQMSEILQILKGGRHDSDTPQKS